jgi:hypothetical protein
MLDDRRAAAALGQRGQEMVWSRFTADRMAEQTAVIYAGYLGGRAGHG